MRIAIAYAEVDGSAWPNDTYATAMEEWLERAGHAVERIVVPLSSRQSPQQQALACQLIPTDAYGDELWTLNFPACLLGHDVRRIWFTRATPFGTDVRAPSASLGALLPPGAASVHVACRVLRDRLGLTGDDVQIGLPPAPVRETATEAVARNGAGVLIVPEPSTTAASVDAWSTRLRETGVTSVTELVAGDGRCAEHRDTVANASAVLIREDAIARLFDHALLAVQVGTPVLLLSRDEHAVVWTPAPNGEAEPAPKSVAFGDAAMAQSRWLDDAIALACKRIDAQMQEAR